MAKLKYEKGIAELDHSDEENLVNLESEYWENCRIVEKLFSNLIIVRASHKSACLERDRLKVKILELKFPLKN